jgi:hypothetical protein
MIRSMTAYASAEARVRWGTSCSSCARSTIASLSLAFRAAGRVPRTGTCKLRERIEKASRAARSMSPCAFARRRKCRSSCASTDAFLDNLRHARARNSRQQVSGMRTDAHRSAGVPGRDQRARARHRRLQTPNACSLFDRRSTSSSPHARARRRAQARRPWCERLDGIAAIVAQVREWLPDIRAGLRQKFETRMAELKQPLDPGRLEQELVLCLPQARCGRGDRSPARTCRGSAQRVLD